MPEVSVVVAFLLAVLALQVLPGPDMMLIIARGIGQGRCTALTCVAGFSAAGIIQIPALALGVATLFEQSPLAYSILKNLGALYLVYLGVRFIISSLNSQTEEKSVVTSTRAAFTQGFWNNLLNPKVLVFMLAFLPQFVDPARGSVASQLVFFGILHKLCGFSVNGLIALMSGAAGSWLKKRRTFIKWQERLVGGVLILLGLRLAFGSRS